MRINGLDNFLQMASSIPADVPQDDPRLPQSCRVLVVDDDELVRTSLTTLLRTREFDVESAASGADALRIMAAAPCQILLTDWQMPDMDGLSLCQSVRDNQPDRYVYVLLHTVRDGEEALLAGLAAGADDYVVKGAPVSELLARLEVGRRDILWAVGRGLRASKRCGRNHATAAAVSSRITIDVGSLLESNSAVH
jgi:DNA-binding response OmpR family regulator